MCHGSTCNVFNPCRRIHSQILALKNATCVTDAGNSRLKLRKFRAGTQQVNRSQRTCQVEKKRVHARKSNVLQVKDSMPRKTQGNRRRKPMIKETLPKQAEPEGNPTRQEANPNLCRELDPKETLAKRTFGRNLKETLAKHEGNPNLQKETEGNPCKT